QDVGPADPPLAIALGRQPCDAGGGDNRVRRGGGQRPVQFWAGQREDGGGPHTSLTQPLLDQRTFDAAARLGEQDQRGAAVGGAVACRRRRRWLRAAHAGLLPLCPILAHRGNGVTTRWAGFTGPRTLSPVAARLRVVRDLLRNS